MKHTSLLNGQTDAQPKRSDRSICRRAFSKGLALGLLTLAAVIVLTGSLAYGEGGGDALFINPNGNVGIGTTDPKARLDVQQGNRTGTNHPKSVKVLYVTGDFEEASGIEFRHNNESQGIGFGYNTIYATGSNDNQSLTLKPRGTEPVKVEGTIKVKKLQIGETSIGEEELKILKKLASDFGEDGLKILKKLASDFGLVAYYPFNGDARDESGNGNHGIVASAKHPRLTVDRHDKASSAYQFESESVYRPNLGHSSSVVMFKTERKSFDKSKNLSVSLWIKVYNFDLPFVVSVPLVSCSDFCVSLSFNKLSFTMFNQHSVTIQLLEPNTWNHFVGTFDGNTIKAYINGKLVGKQKGKVGDLNIRDVPLRFGIIGAFQYKKNRHCELIWDLDDIRIYNLALTDAKIKELYKE